MVNGSEKKPRRRLEQFEKIVSPELEGLDDLESEGYQNAQKFVREQMEEFLQVAQELGIEVGEFPEEGECSLPGHYYNQQLNTNDPDLNQRMADYERHIRESEDLLSRGRPEIER